MAELIAARTAASALRLEGRSQWVQLIAARTAASALRLEGR